MPDAIVLVGLSGSGKTSIGRLVAERLARPFIDLDEEIERAAGASPAELIRRHGEGRFRELETDAVLRASGVAGVVIATGGGAVIEPLNRWALWHAGWTVWLDADSEQLAGRLASDAVERPLLAGDTRAELDGLRAARQAYYRAADVRLDAGGSPVAVVAAIVEAVAGSAGRSRRLLDARVRRDHPMGPRQARVVLGDGLDGATLAGALSPISDGTPVVVADKRAARALPALMATLPDERRILFGAGERAKRLRTVERFLEAASRMGAERGDAWVGVGGGTTTDMVGAAAALYLRGVPFAAVPTTWLAMTDAAIGGKVGVDLAAAKNAAGAFWPPAAIVADQAAIDTLPRARRLDGMAESLKSGLIGDPMLWDLVERRGRAALHRDVAARYALIDRSVQLKLAVVERDPFERGERRSLNLGHTLGHALEVESGYRLPHGQAVVLGLRAVAAIAQGRGAEPGLDARIDAVVADLGFALERDFDARAVKALLGSDKKRVRGRQRWILPMAVGRTVEVDDVSEAELDAAMARIRPGRARAAA